MSMSSESQGKDISLGLAMNRYERFVSLSLVFIALVYVALEVVPQVLLDQGLYEQTAACCPKELPSHPTPDYQLTDRNQEGKPSADMI